MILERLTDVPSLSFITRNLWKEDARMQSQVKHASEQLKNAERTMTATMDRASSTKFRSPFLLLLTRLSPIRIPPKD